MIASQGDEMAPVTTAWRCYAAVFALAILFLYLANFRDGIFVWQLSQQEGGTHVDEAFQILHGQLIYRDFFEMLAPGIFYVDAFFLWLLGPTPTSVGIMIIALGVACALAIFAISDVVLSSYWRYVPAAIFIGLTYPSYSPGNHKWPTTLLCLVGILAVLKTRSRLRCGASGIAHGGAVLCTQDFGVAATLGMAAALWLLRGRKDGSHPLTFLSVCGMTVAIVLGGFAAAVGFGTIWYDLVGFLFEQYGTSHVLTFGLGSWKLFPLWLTSFGLGGLGLAYAVSGVARRFWRSDPPSLVIVTLAGAGLLFIGGLAHPIEPTLFGVRAVPLTIIGVYLLQRAVQSRVAYPALAVGLTALGVLVMGYAAIRPIRIQFTAPLVMEAHRAGKIWTYDRLDDLFWLEANTVEGQPVFLYPDKGGFYFLSGTRGAVSYPRLYDMGFNTNAQVADAIGQLAKQCPAVGIWHENRLLSFNTGRPELNTLKPLEQFLMRNYDIVAEFPNGAKALRRKHPAPECVA